VTDNNESGSVEVYKTEKKKKQPKVASHENKKQWLKVCQH
jgi:hypothetical protein